MTMAKGSFSENKHKDVLGSVGHTDSGVCIYPMKLELCLVYPFRPNNVTRLH